MPGVAIVAIPEQNDPVWKYSSEKIPHLTLLYLGENVTHEAEITQFVRHAAENAMSRFFMQVERRGTFGADDADVLFFENDSGWAKEISEFRSNLLGNRYIREAYDSTFQYPKWTPHLTMGYPESPAKKDDRDYPGFHGVHFDQIAIWFGDFDGPVFNLDSQKDLELAMSDRVDNFIAHFGVKGMRWGVRKTSDGSIQKTSYDKNTTAYRTKIGTTKMSDRAMDKAFSKASYELKAKSIQEAPKDPSKLVVGITEMSSDSKGNVYVMRVVRNVPRSIVERNQSGVIAALDDAFSTLHLNQERYFDE